MTGEGGEVSAHVERQIGYLTFSHPAHNSLPTDLLQSMTGTILKWGADPKVKAILIKSAGDRTFCSGANFQELASIQDQASGVDFFMGFARLINAIRTCSKLVAGRIQGKAVGGGVGIAAAFDYTFATKWASIKLSEISLGIGPFVIEPALERKIGLASFSALALNPSRWQTARWAGNAGLYQHVFETIEEMDNQLEYFLDELRTYDLQALQAMKEVLWEGTDHWDQLLQQRAEKSGRLVLSNFTRNKLYDLLKQ